MGFATTYLDKQKDFKQRICGDPHQGLKYIVVIPCFYEFNLIETLNSIWNAERINNAIEVIIVINSSETAEQKVKDQNILTYNEVNRWIEGHKDSFLRFFVLLEEDLPSKFAGAGLARKIGMDQAIARFNQLNNEDGIIISLDADSKIKSNYFIELDNHLQKYPKTNIVTTYFEHPVIGNEFDPSVYTAIATYELYLRYYKLAMDYSGFPYSFYTVGSCFAVKAKAYVKQGGMNRKQAGEDFYFLHKVFPLGNSYEINTTCVYPSSRPSERVPFGTGPMVKSISESGSEHFLTYNLDAFIDLKVFLESIDKLYEIDSSGINEFLKQLPESISVFLTQSEFSNAVQEINNNSSSLKTFTKRFFSWFDAFRILKYLNFSHGKYFNKKPLLGEAQKLFKLISSQNAGTTDYKGLLEQYRKLERQF